MSLFFTQKKQNNILYIWNRISQKETSYKTSNSDAFKSFHCNQLVFDTEFQILKIYTTEIELHQVQVFTYELNILTKPLSVKVWDILPWRVECDAVTQRFPFRCLPSIGSNKRSQHERYSQPFRYRALKWANFTNNKRYITGEPVFLWRSDGTQHMTIAIRFTVHLWKVPSLHAVWWFGKLKSAEISANLSTASCGG